MTKIKHVLRITTGLALAFFGLMMLLAVVPDPHAAWENQKNFSPEAKYFILQLWDSNYLMHTVCLAHLLSGILLLANRFVPLALIMHLPVSIQMTLFHAFMDVHTGLVAYMVLILNGTLMYLYRDSYKSLLSAKTGK